MCGQGKAGTKRGDRINRVGMQKSTEKQGPEATEQRWISPGRRCCDEEAEVVRLPAQCTVRL